MSKLREATLVFLIQREGRKITKILLAMKKRKKIPYKKMWPDDIMWLPKVLKNKKLKCRFTFGENDIIIDQQIKIIKLRDGKNA